MLSQVPVSEVMTTDVISFTTDENVAVAMRRLVDRGVDAGPVVDTEHRVVGILSTGDLVVEEARLHFPTVVNFLGVNITMPFDKKALDDSVSKALGATVGDVMTADPFTLLPTATIEDAATLMHDHNVSRLPVVDGSNRLVGIVARGDIVRAIIASEDRRADGDGATDNP
jgi:CBS domain-containing protein